MALGFTEADMYKCRGVNVTGMHDRIIIESPLTIMIEYGQPGQRKQEVLTVTMRTPADDVHLVKGLLLAEGIIQKNKDILDVKPLINTQDTLQQDTVLAVLSEHIQVNLGGKQRNLVTTSACGFCGKTTDDSHLPQQHFKPADNQFRIAVNNLYKLPSLLKQFQGLFNTTGGAHAVALVTASGDVIAVAEDVGRHNAMDKLVGAMLEKESFPLSNYLVLFSGRLGYELVQKALAAGIPFICAIGAPTSLAVELAKAYGITIAGFLKEDSFNIYCGSEKMIQA